MLVSGVVNLIVSKKVLYPVARRTESAALEADAAHLLTDVYTSFGVAFGLLLVKITGWAYLDPIAAIAVAVLIIKTGYELVMQSTRVLLDETLPDDELEEIRRCVARAPRRHHLRLPQAARAPGRQPAAHRPARARGRGPHDHARRTTSPSTSRPTSAAACPTPTCWCTSSRATHDRDDRRAATPRATEQRRPARRRRRRRLRR